MNEQPYGVPCEHWPPKLTPWWFRLCKWFRDRDLRSQKMTDITLLGCDAIARAVDRNAGILLAPNHSFHWDSYCLLRAAEQLRVPFYFMTAWQVFEVSSRFTRESMQRCGCFSVDREGTDMQALKTAVDILKTRTNPLVVFPEGDIYHTNDRVTPFREGAAAMALMAAKKSDRPVAVIPVAIKRWYLDDPTSSLQQTVSRIERSLHWTEKAHRSLRERVLHIAEGLLALKETEYLNTTQQGSLRARIQGLMLALLNECEAKYSIAKKDTLPPERIKGVRQAIIQQRESQRTTATERARREWDEDMNKMFMATQLYSYPGTYLGDADSIERLVETVDKLEEDVLGCAYPTVHGAKRVTVQFDTPIWLDKNSSKSSSASTLTAEMQHRVQTLLDSLNATPTP
ncbi:1-acyl-sn-glycerol-3-phosphate acyltransferase [Pirellula sp. SH-Sr6A]|nr:1-acyl-sn-glycerol-3-phosphate acyltransferase [Pirellula sp. SH-Sr6A]